MAILKRLAVRIYSMLVPFIGRHLSVFYFSPELLDLPRCKQADVARAVQTARNAHAGEPVYLLTDQLGLSSDSATKVDSVAALRAVPRPCAVILACNSDELALAAVNFIKTTPGMHYYGTERFSPPARYFHRNEVGRQVLKDAVSAKLTKFDLADFENIIQAIDATRNLEGDYVEIGVYKGSSALIALDYMQRRQMKRRCYFLDTFSGFDYAEASASADRIWQNTHADTGLDLVKEKLSRFSVPHEVIRSNIIADELPKTINGIAVCNIDVDMYEAVAAALKKVAPLVLKGGIIIAEDQGHTPMLIGAYAAVVEFLASETGRSFVPVHLMSGQMFLIKT